MKPLLLKHLSGESIGRFPVWMMRQAGRYLPRYQEIRRRNSFWEMVTSPDLATEVSLLPLEVAPVDGVILFSDILTLPYGQGVKIQLEESIGPVVTEPLTTVAQFTKFLEFSPNQHTSFVGETLRRLRGQMSSDLALFGFAGAPWTVATYLIEGRGKRFDKITQWLYRDAKTLAIALSHLEEATLRYLLFQAEAGADVVQLFDTWLSEMPRPFFVEHYLPSLNRIFAVLREKRVPTIYFTKGAHHLMPDFQSLLCDVLSVDDHLPLPEVESRTAGKFCLQGNLNPYLLMAEESLVRSQTRRLVQEAKKLKRPAILNLAHGILPGTSVENVRAFVDEARTLWI